MANNENVFIQKLYLQNFLSYGSRKTEVELRSLNVFIGANGSGKSNLIEALGVFKTAPTDLTSSFRQGGGIGQFLWKRSKGIPTATLEAVIGYPERSQNLRYHLDFTEVGGRLELVDEFVENEKAYEGESDVYFYYRYQKGNPVLNLNISEQRQRKLKREDLSLDQSVLSQRKDSDLYPELSYLSDKLSRIVLYRDWQIGRNSEARKPQSSDFPEHPLEETVVNLGMFLNNLEYQIGTRNIVDTLREFSDLVESFTVRIYANTVQIFFREEGNVLIPATRLSDGTVRFLFLTALLLDPTPPPLICIEEPELGLHPDIMPIIAEMMIEASERTQLIVTTHSDALVSALSGDPESVIVCERTQDGTQLHRLESEQLRDWLQNYTLGDLWRMGEIGGNK